MLVNEIRQTCEYFWTHLLYTTKLAKTNDAVTAICGDGTVIITKDTFLNKKIEKRQVVVNKI